MKLWLRERGLFRSLLKPREGTPLAPKVDSFIPDKGSWTEDNLRLKVWPGTDLVVFDQQDTFHWSLTHNEIKDLEYEILALLPEPDDPLQKFLRHYLGYAPRKESRWRGSLTRMAMNFRLVEAHLPHGGRWAEAGAFGIEAIIINRRRPDAVFSLYNYEGCALTQDKHGVHFLTELAGRSDYIWVEQVDLERHVLSLPASSVDVFASFETIEHFKFGPQLFMCEVNRVLKTGGRLIVSMPNANSITAYERLVLNTHPAECRTYHPNLEYGRIHPSEYDREQITGLLIENGFEIESLVTASIVPLTKRQSRLIEELTRVRLSEHLQVPQDFGAKWFAVARKVITTGEQKLTAALFG